MKLRRVIVLMLMIVLCCTALASCGDNDLDTGVFSVKTSSDWEIVKRKVDGKSLNDQVYVIKNGEETTSHPNILICYYEDPTEYHDERSFYKSAEDVEPITAGDRTWEGYTFSLFGSSEACLTAKEGNALWVCRFTLEKGKEKISLNDNDVKDILASLKAK